MLTQMVEGGQIVHYHRPVDVPPAQRDRFTSRSPIDFYAFRKGGAGLVIECKAMKGFSAPPKETAFGENSPPNGLLEMEAYSI